MPKEKDRIILTIAGEGERIHGFEIGFWLKFVSGFNPDHHCLASLLGYKDPRIRRDMPLNIPVDLSTYRGLYQYIYLCGVSGRGWSTNFHLVTRPEPGTLAQTETYNGLQVSMTNSRRLEIPAVADGFMELPPAYTTCRNWRFGVHCFGFPEGWTAPAEAKAAGKRKRRSRTFGGGRQDNLADAIVFGRPGRVDARAFDLAPLVGQVDDNVFEVPSASGGGEYIVTLGDKPTCTCKHGEHWNHAGARCVHVAAARVANGDVKSAQLALFPDLLNPLKQRRRE